MGNFVNSRKNFPDAQKLSGWQCQRANDVFGTLKKDPIYKGFQDQHKAEPLQLNA